MQVVDAISSHVAQIIKLYEENDNKTFFSSKQLKIAASLYILLHFIIYMNYSFCGLKKL